MYIAVPILNLKNLSNIPDQDLTADLKNGSRDAYEEIFRRYWLRVYKSVYARVRVHEEAEEIVQDLFVTIWLKRDVLVIPDLSNYLFAAARKRVLNHIRSHVVRVKYFNYFRNFNSFWNLVVEEEVEYEELKNNFEKAISRLPKKTQEVFRLSRLEGYSIEEIAAYLKLPKRTIGYHITKSMKEFRLYLKDFILSIICLFLA